MGTNCCYSLIIEVPNGMDGPLAERISLVRYLELPTELDSLQQKRTLRQISRTSAYIVELLHDVIIFHKRARRASTISRRLFTVTCLWKYLRKTLLLLSLYPCFTFAKVVPIQPKEERKEEGWLI